MILMGTGNAGGGGIFHIFSFDPVKRMFNNGCVNFFSMLKIVKLMFDI